jgi:hypothetical protein
MTSELAQVAPVKNGGATQVKDPVAGNYEEHVRLLELFSFTSHRDVFTCHITDSAPCWRVWNVCLSAHQQMPACTYITVSIVIG